MAVDYLLAVAELERLGHRAAALESYRAATLRWPEVSASWLGIGNIYYHRSELRQARLAYRRALDVNPDDLAARNNLAQAIAELGCPDRALGLLEGFFEADQAASKLLSETRAEIRAMPRMASGCTALALD
jgi:tetratricopeptide (TPR) repeat protein